MQAYRNQESNQESNQVYNQAINQGEKVINISHYSHRMDSTLNCYHLLPLMLPLSSIEEFMCL